MATDDDAPAADSESADEDALEGGGDESPSTLEGDTVDRAAGDAADTSVEEAGGLPATDAADVPADGSNHHTETTADARIGSDDAARDASADESDEPGADGPEVAVGAYTWADFLDEYGVDGDVTALYRGLDPHEVAADDDDAANARWDDGETVEIPTPTRADWDEVSLDPEAYLDFHPVDTDSEVTAAIAEAARISAEFEAFCDPATTPVVKDVWMWEHYKREYYYEDDGSRPRDDAGEIDRFDGEDALGFDPDVTENALARGGQRAAELRAVVDERTVDVDPEFDEDAFFTDVRGATTVANRYDLEKAVPLSKKTHFKEVERYWVDKPHAFVIIFHSTKENEKKYYVIDPYQNRIEDELVEFLTGKLRTAIKYDDDSVVGDGPTTRRRVIEQQALELLDRYNLYQVPDRPRQAGLSILPSRSTDTEGGGLLSQFDLDLDLDFDVPFGTDEPAEQSTDSVAADGSGSATAGDSAAASEHRLASVARSLGLEAGSLGGRLDGLFADSTAGRPDPSLDGIAARPEPAVLAEDAARLTDYQVEKLLYVLRRDFIGYERIDGIKHDVNVEDISCDGYNAPVFVYHSDYEQIISNVYHGEAELDDFVVKLAQRSGKGISKRRPQVDATLPDGSRAQLTLGREVSDHGTNYTIRQFKDVPFTPIDLVNWKTFSLEEMAFLWLCIENDKSLIFAGGTASGKTTSLNAVSLFIPSNAKIVSIEDTREVELPQRNWVASVTRPSFSDDDRGDVDEFDLLEAALRQRPDYIVMGEIRGEEGRTLFQVMSTGHTTYTTFHADSVGEVLKRFTTDPINVSKTMFTALDLVSIQTSTRVHGDKVRRNKSLTEINHYDAENDEINVQDVYQWQAEGDEFLKMGASNTLEDVRFDRGWSRERLDEELFKRRVVLAYLIDRGLNTYTQVAATLQAFINDQETILALMAHDDLERSLEDLREMESVEIDVDPEKEEMVPRPDPDEDIRELCREILDRAAEELWPDYQDLDDVEVADALIDVDTAPDVTADVGEHSELDALEERSEQPALEDSIREQPDALDGETATEPETDGVLDGDTVTESAAAGETPPENDAVSDESGDDNAHAADEPGDDSGDVVWGEGGADAADATADTESFDLFESDSETAEEPDSSGADASGLSTDDDGRGRSSAAGDDDFGIEDLLDGTAEVDDGDGDGDDEEGMWDFGEFESVEPSDATESDARTDDDPAGGSEGRDDESESRSEAPDDSDDESEDPDDSDDESEDPDDSDDESEDPDDSDDGSEDRSEETGDSGTATDSDGTGGGER